MLKYLINIINEGDNFTYVWYSLGTIHFIYAYLISKKSKTMGKCFYSLIGILLVVGRLEIAIKLRNFLLLLTDFIIIILAHITLMKLKKGQIKGVKGTEKIESH